MFRVLATAAAACLLAASPAWGSDDVAKKDVKRWTKQCDKGDAPSCRELAQGHKKGRGRYLGRDVGAMFRFAEAGCALGDAETCELLGDELVKRYGKGVQSMAPERVLQAADAYVGACEGGRESACASVAELTKTRQARAALSIEQRLGIHQRACDAGYAASCAWAGALAKVGEDEELAATSAQVHERLVQAAAELRACTVMAQIGGAEELPFTLRLAGSDDFVAVRMVGDGEVPLNLEPCLEDAFSQLDVPLAEGSEVALASVPAVLHVGAEGEHGLDLPDTAAFYGARCREGDASACVVLASWPSTAGRPASPDLAEVGGGCDASALGGRLVKAHIDDRRVERAMTRDVFDSVIKLHTSEIKQCYEPELKADPSLAGRVDVVMTIGAHGAVCEASAGRSTVGNEKLEACLVNHVSQMRFPPTKGGEKLVVTYPFLFSP